MNRPWLVTALVLCSPFLPGPLTAAEDARPIVEEAQKRSTSASERYEGLLQSFNSDGKMAEKRWVFERLGAHGQSKSIIRFASPAEIKGVALLIVNHPDRQSDQWMWTPAIARDRRVSLQDRSTRFFGTDFSFEDLEERDVNQFTHTLLGDDTIDGALSWKIESVPKPTRRSQYTKSMVWIRKDNYATARIDSYVKDAVVRRLESSQIRQVQGIWTAHESVMTDLRRRTRTRLALEKVEYNIPLRDDDMTLQGLRRP